MTRRIAHRVEHTRVADVARFELFIDHADALGFPVEWVLLRLSSTTTAG